MDWFILLFALTAIRITCELHFYETANI